MDRVSREINKISIILPVYNEPENLRIMVQILEATVDFPHEILVVYDSPQDTSIDAVRWLKLKYPNIRAILNDLGCGVANAIKKGISVSTGEVILITLVDEVFPIAVVSDMIKLINQNCDFVSCTRYALGGRRLGGSFFGGTLSRLANRAFRIITGSVLSDATTGIKMVRRSVFEEINIEAKAGWAFAFEISIKAQILGLRIGEVPVVSVDRLFGGESKFKLGAWTAEYMRWFLWGAKRLNRFNKRQIEVITLDKHRRKRENKLWSFFRLAYLKKQ